LVNGKRVFRRLLRAAASSADFGADGPIDAGDLLIGTLTGRSPRAVVNFGIHGLLDAGDLPAGKLTCWSTTAVLGFPILGGCFLDSGLWAGTLPRRSAIATLDFGMGGGLYPNLLGVLAVVLATSLLLVRREGILLSLGCRGLSSVLLVG
jgi:hypothetical protein